MSDQDRTRRTSNVINKLPVYFKQSTPPSDVNEKIGDMWFNETSEGRVGSGKPLLSMQKIVDKRKEKEASKSKPKIKKIDSVRSKKEKAERPPIKIPKLKKKRSL